MPGPDMRALLGAADAAASRGDYVAAVRGYAEAARIYAGADEPLKAVAVFRRVRTLIAKHAQSEASLDAEARSKLAALYRTLGLETDAQAVDEESPGGDE